MRAGQVAHVLDDTSDPLVGLQCDGASSLGDLLRGQLRCRDDQDLRGREELRDGDRDVTRARRQVHQQVVEVAPVHVGEELLQRPVEHRPAPDDGGVVLGEHPDRDDLHAVCRWRHDHLLDLGGLVLHAEHAGDGEAVDVGVQDTHSQTLGGHRGRHVDRHRRLAHTTLAGRDREDPGQRPGHREGDLAYRVVAAQQGLQSLALLGAHHVELDDHGRDATEAGDRCRHPLGQGVLHRAPRDRQVDRDSRSAVGVDGRGLDHPDVGDRPVDLRVLDRRQRRGELFGCGQGGHGSPRDGAVALHWSRGRRSGQAGGGGCTRPRCSAS